LSGHLKDEVGRFDKYVALARLHNWTPDQVRAMPADFVVELIAYHNATDKKARRDEVKQKREAKRKHG
jgi:3-keto-L-gulonate-6-phosphate decarboxylase